MPDYGHDLLFGTFITPSNAAPDKIVGLARESETAGLDLVTFQDHPYQSAFLDTWTLLSYVAARTGPSGGPRRRMTSGSGWGRTSRGCCG